jgi:hypothetical protein
MFVDGPNYDKNLVPEYGKAPIAGFVDSDWLSLESE